MSEKGTNYAFLDIFELIKSAISSYIGYISLTLNNLTCFYANSF